MPLDFAAVDFETANYNPWSVCSVGVAFVQDGQVSETLHFLVRPPSRVFVPMVCVHRLTWDDVRHEASFAEVWAQLAPRLKHKVLFAHSASFDKRVLEACAKRFRIPRSAYPFVCTRALAANILGIRPTSLEDVCRRLRISLNHHHAGSDATAASKIALKAAARLRVTSARAFLPDYSV